MVKAAIDAEHGTFARWSTAGTEGRFLLRAFSSSLFLSERPFVVVDTAPG
jgi:hypothetical protein